MLTQNGEITALIISAHFQFTQATAISGLRTLPPDDEGGGADGGVSTCM